MKKSEAKQITMIKVTKGTRAKLKAMKGSEREPYDKVINMLIKLNKVLQKLKKWLEKKHLTGIYPIEIVLPKIKELEDEKN